MRIELLGHFFGLEEYFFENLLHKLESETQVI